MTINEHVDEIEQQICCHEITKEQVFTKMKYFIQQLQNTSSNNKYEKCSKYNNKEKVIGEKCEYCDCE